MRQSQLLASIAIVGAVLLANPAVAQTSPETVAVAYVGAIKADGLAAAADYIHPDELQRFKAMFSPLFANPASPSAKVLAQAVFGPEATVESVATLDPLAFMRGFMSFVDGQLKSVNMTFGDVQILGAVSEGDIVHLVTRNTAGASGVQITQLEVMSLKPSGDTWKLLLTGQIEGLAQALTAAGAAGR